MVESGIKPNEEISKIFNEVKINRTLKGMVLAIESSNKDLIVEKEFSKEAEYKEIFDSLPKDEPR
jgi:hypothetical protein